LAPWSAKLTSSPFITRPISHPHHPQRRSPISPQTPGQAAAALANLPITETLTTALDAAATRLADAIRAELATQPGGPHDHPWRQTGALQASIAHTTNGLTAEIGSNDPAAAPQEYGTATIPPRPFLAPAATALADPIAQDIAAALTALLARAIN
jgi:phage gpG-like protein